MALRLTNDDYFKRIKDDVFKVVRDDINLSDERYTVSTIFRSDLDVIDDVDIISYRLVSGKSVKREDKQIIYRLEYSVNAEAILFGFLCENDDTNEILLQPKSSHEFDGHLTVEVLREADLFIDFNTDSTFLTARILKGSFSETDYYSFASEDDEVENEDENED
jgi:hypothetical protein